MVRIYLLHLINHQIQFEMPVPNHRGPIIKHAGGPTLTGAEGEDVPGHGLGAGVVVSGGQTQLPARRVGGVAVLRVSQAGVEDPGPDLIR